MIHPQIRVLLVEDDVATAAATRRILLRNAADRFAVVCAGLLDDAVTALEQENFDAILLDLNLPDSTGLDTLTRLLELAPEVAIIVLTATDDGENGIRAVQLGAQDFLIKGSFNDAFLQRSVLYGAERHRMQRTIRQLAIMDELTGLCNRRGFLSLHHEVFNRVRSRPGRGFLVYFDLDQFKAINDQYGHQAGDETLVEFAVSLREVFRKDTLLVRFGGDEFLAMGLETRPGQTGQTLRALEELLDQRNSSPCTLPPLRTSRGTHYFDRNDDLNADHIIAQADAALYRDKNGRRKSVHPEIRSVSA